MTYLPKERYIYLGKVFEVLDFSKEEVERYVERFDDALMKKVVGAVVKKLPEQKRRAVVEVANKATESKSGQKKLKEKLTYWFNEDEIKRLFDKVSAELFRECLQNAYKQATEEQKKKLEEMFKPEALGIN